MLDVNVSFLIVYFFCDTQTSNEIMYGVMFSSDHSAMNLQNQVH